MNSRLAVKMVSLATLLVSAGFAERQARSEPPMNVVFILTDDMRWDSMGCAGNPIVQTPNLDRLASQGVLFRNMFCTTSICSVSRTSILTGQYERRHQVVDFDTPLSEEAFSLTYLALLRKAGYHTAFVGKWGLGGALPTDQFDYWDGFSGQGRYFEKEPGEHLTSRIARKATDFIAKAGGNKPFLLCVSTKAPHVQDQDPRQFIPDPRYDHLYQNTVIPTPRSAIDEAFGLMPPFIRNSENRTRWDRRFATPEMYQQMVKNYYRLISGVDEAVGQIVGSLQSTGLSQNTVVVFTSDNGFFLGEHGLAGKWLMHEESIRLPLIVHDPRLPSFLRNQQPTEMALNIDLAPTMLALAGVKPPRTMQGRSLLPIVHGTAHQWRKDFFYEHHYGHNGRIAASEGVRTERWKYIRYLNSEPPFEELYDLQNDPQEIKNLADQQEYSRLLAQLRTRWQQWRKWAE